MQIYMELVDAPQAPNKLYLHYRRTWLQTCCTLRSHGCCGCYFGLMNPGLGYRIYRVAAWPQHVVLPPLIRRQQMVLDTV